MGTAGRAWILTLVFLDPQATVPSSVSNSTSPSPEDFRPSAEGLTGGSLGSKVKGP